jgi:phosphate transport system substrate-binding protein
LDYIEIPVAYDAIAVVVNPQNTWCDYLTVAELKKDLGACSARQKSRSGRRYARVFPDEPLVLFGAGTDSGTFDYFTAAIVGKEKASRGRLHGQRG